MHTEQVTGEGKKYLLFLFVAHAGHSCTKAGYQPASRPLDPTPMAWPALYLHGFFPKQQGCLGRDSTDWGKARKQ